MYAFIDLMCGIIVPLIIVFIIFVCIKKDKLKKILLIFVLTIYLGKLFDIVGITSFTFWKWNPIINIIPFSDLINKGFTFQIMFQYIANAILFIPLGFLLPIIWDSFKEFKYTITTGLLISLIIELIQLLTFRVSAIDDIIMNTIGTIIGYFIITYLINRKRKSYYTYLSFNHKLDVKELLIIVLLVLISAILIKYPLGCLIYGYI